MRSAPLRDVPQCRLVIPKRSFGSTYRYRLQGIKTFEYGTYTLYRNVGTELTTLGFVISQNNADLISATCFGHKSPPPVRRVSTDECILLYQLYMQKFKNK